MKILLILGVTCLFLVCLLVWAFIAFIKVFLSDEENTPEHLEYYTTDGRLRSEAFPTLKGHGPAQED